MADKAILFDSSRCSACQACVAACKGRFGLGPASSSEDMAARAFGRAAVLDEEAPLAVARFERTLADGGTVSRVYRNSLTEYAPEGDVVYIVTDTATLAGLGAEYTVLRDYGDVFWSVRMNINDLTANFTTEFVLPEAPQYGVGRRG